MSALRRSLLALPFAILLAETTLAQTSATPALRPDRQVAKRLLEWSCFGKNVHHSAGGGAPAQHLNQIRWSSPVDQTPQYSGPYLLIHYGSPMASAQGTIVFPVKTGAFSGFIVEGRANSNGSLLWSTSTDYEWPPLYNWSPSVGCTLTATNGVAIPARGGTVLVRGDVDQASASVTRYAFFGLATYNANQALYNANVFIDTPITCDRLGNLYFGFVATGSPGGLTSGIARVAANGSGTWVSAGTAAGDGSMQKVVYNCAPALSLDGSSLYVAVTNEAGSGFGGGYLLRLNSSTLALQSKVRLKDTVSTSNDAYLPDDGTASPAVGPDGDVYVGVLENPFYSNDLRGWMLHFSADLSQTKLPGAFGWDNTASIVPRSAVPSYAGPSSYLVLTKYNHYAGVGSGDGVNKVAVLDPGVSMVDPYSGATVMDEVIVIAGPTPDPSYTPTYPNAVREWCINTAAVDAMGHCALVNCEDGKLYRWDFDTNTLSETMVLTSGLGEAYTPTMLGPDGTVYAINNATLFAVGQ